MTQLYSLRPITFGVLFLAAGLASCTGPERHPRSEPPSSEPLAQQRDDLLYSKLATTFISRVNWSEVPLEQALRIASETSGIPVSPNWSGLSAAGIERDKPITFTAGRMSCAALMEHICEIAGGGETALAFEASDGTINFSTKEDLDRLIEVRIYDVRDLVGSKPATITILEPPPSQEGVFDGRPLTTRPVTVTTVTGMDQLVELISDTIDPESWRQAGGTIGSITPFGRCLVIAQTSNAHRQIRDLLHQLRAAHARWEPQYSEYSPCLRGGPN